MVGGASIILASSPRNLTDRICLIKIDVVSTCASARYTLRGEKED